VWEERNKPVFSPRIDHADSAETSAKGDSAGSGGGKARVTEERRRREWAGGLRGFNEKKKVYEPLEEKESGRPARKQPTPGESEKISKAASSESWGDS